MYLRPGELVVSKFLPPFTVLLFLFYFILFFILFYFFLFTLEFCFVFLTPFVMSGSFLWGSTLRPSFYSSVFSWLKAECVRSTCLPGITSDDVGWQQQRQQHGWLRDKQIIFSCLVLNGHANVRLASYCLGDLRYGYARSLRWRPEWRRRSQPNAPPSIFKEEQPKWWKTRTRKGHNQLMCITH